MKLDNYTGRITYRKLANIINYYMTEKQMDMDVTAAIPLHDEMKLLFGKPHITKQGDCGAIGLQLVQPTQDEIDDLELDDNHPVFIALDTGE